MFRIIKYRVASGYSIEQWPVTAMLNLSAIRRQHKVTYQPGAMEMLSTEWGNNAATPCRLESMD
jgi:hypothetical protein